MAEAIGIDIGGTHIRAGRIGPAGELLAQAERPSERDARAVLMTCLNLVAEFRTPDVAAVGVGIPGRVVNAGRRVLSGGYVFREKKKILTKPIKPQWIASTRTEGSKIWTITTG